MGIGFDGTITLGALLNAFVLLVGFVVAFTRIGGRIDLLSQRVGNLERAVTNSEGIDKQLATIQERVTNHVTLLSQFQKDISDARNASTKDIASLRSEINDLRRGTGWIQARPRTTVDGEY